MMQQIMTHIVLTKKLIPHLINLTLLKRKREILERETKGNT
jgi:hypothetical protein